MWLAQKICSETLMCWSPNRVGAFYAGPALEGTKCGKGGRHCIEGECRDMIQWMQLWIGRLSPNEIHLY